MCWTDRYIYDPFHSIAVCHSESARQWSCRGPPRVLRCTYLCLRNFARAGVAFLSSLCCRGRCLGYEFSSSCCFLFLDFGMRVFFFGGTRVERYTYTVDALTRATTFFSIWLHRCFTMRLESIYWLFGSSWCGRTLVMSIWAPVMSWLLIFHCFGTSIHLESFILAMSKF